MRQSTRSDGASTGVRILTLLYGIFNRVTYSDRTHIQKYMFRTLPFAKISFRSRTNPINELASEHEFEIQLMNLQLKAHVHLMTISSLDM